jgi:GxxExxY protein
VKAVDRILSVHHAQVMTYLRLSGLHHGLLLNFNASRLVEGLTSFLV